MRRLTDTTRQLLTGRGSGPRFELASGGDGRHMDATGPILRFDDSMEAATRLVPEFGYDEAEQIMLDALREHRRVDAVAEPHLGGIAA